MSVLSNLHQQINLSNHRVSPVKQLASDDIQLSITHSAKAPVDKLNLDLKVNL